MLRKSPTRTRSKTMLVVTCRSDAHRHDHGDVIRRAVWTHDDGVELSADADLDPLLVEAAEHVEEVPRVEPDGDIRAVVVHGDLVEAFTAVGALAREPHRPAGERQL